MLEVGGSLDLLHEPLGAQYGGEFGTQDLDGDFALVLQVLGRGRRWPCRLRRGGVRSCSGRRGRWRGGRCFRSWGTKMGCLWGFGEVLSFFFETSAVNQRRGASIRDNRIAKNRPRPRRNDDVSSVNVAINEPCDTEHLCSHASRPRVINVRCRIGAGVAKLVNAATPQVVGRKPLSVRIRPPAPSHTID